MFFELDQLLIYRNALQDGLIIKLRENLQTEGALESCPEFVCELIKKAEEKGLEGNVLTNYMIYLIMQEENIFSTTIEKTGGRIGTSLYTAVIHDIAILKKWLKACKDSFFKNSIIADYRPTYTVVNESFATLRDCFLDITRVYTSQETADLLIQHYASHGYGEMASSAAFRWDKKAGLVAITDYDAIRLEDIVGYERQKQVLISNTEALLAGKLANNVLLVGARGTGKSSSVKALVNRYFEKGLRLVEVSKNELKDLYEIMNALRTRGKKFIIFLDDLSFEDFEVEYKVLKSVIEGGIQSKPENVLIYATSNRRHLVREVWSDRAGTGDEVHHSDSVNEKISLSDRFGITLTYASPNQEEYLRIVEEIAKKQKISLPSFELRAEALKWELRHSGRSGRVAQQFIAHMVGRMAVG